jgi:hypothetical protein
MERCAGRNVGMTGLRVERKFPRILNGKRQGAIVIQTMRHDGVSLGFGLHDEPSIWLPDGTAPSVPDTMHAPCLPFSVVFVPKTSHNVTFCVSLQPRFVTR